MHFGRGEDNIADVGENGDGNDDEDENNDCVSRRTATVKGECVSMCISSTVKIVLMMLVI